MSAEITELFLKQIESRGTGRFTSYNIDEEVALINAKASKLSSNQRKAVLYLAEKMKDELAKAEPITELAKG